MSNPEHDQDIKYLRDNLTVYPNFPKPGINFRDTFSLFRNQITYKKVIDLFSDHISKLEVDVIVGLESRGFILGGAICYNLGIPFVPIRKKGKLPGKVIEYKYELEYGQDVFEIQECSIKPNQKVVIVDDLIATGGSCMAAIELLKKVKAQIIECVILVELSDLNWKKNVSVPTTSFIKFDS
ncbi:adenine phosphoribosyltransferase [Brachionus plicatilis]|uniref:Adenine phosphoribosyltransferase n=1 Tax=Brachionus plicatilis TaxID=10195 RepID=A0A3M7RR43_BRAPC|nr:adenine phosphoribosyltransferase [Brachionus plicatilis]